MQRRKKIEQKTDSNFTAKKRGRPKKYPEAAKIETEGQEQIDEIRSGLKKVILRKISAEDLMLQKQKEKIMWSGVLLTMMAIFIFWIIGIKTSISSSNIRDKNDSKEVFEMKNDLQKQMEQINKNFEQIKMGVQKGLASSVVSSTSLPIASSSDYNTNVSELNSQLKEIIIQASSTVNN